ncbi:hypothetical protein DL93DRAFT_1581969 [Clavulina sp. PMI_390]|nr:hypothetical protein DL93DRAFT_1581969 [Clavulina sp. PMI_390]
MMSDEQSTVVVSAQVRPTPHEQQSEHDQRESQVLRLALPTLDLLEILAENKRNSTSSLVKQVRKTLHNAMVSQDFVTSHRVTCLAEASRTPTARPNEGTVLSKSFCICFGTAINIDITSACVPSDKTSRSDAASQTSLAMQQHLQVNITAPSENSYPSLPNIHKNHLQDGAILSFDTYRLWEDARFVPIYLGLVSFLIIIGHSVWKLPKNISKMKRPASGAADPCSTQ